MKLENSHPTERGQSLVEKIRDELDLAYEIAIDYELDTSKEFSSEKYYAQGIACALGVLRSTSEDEEWKLAEERYGS